MVQTPASPRSIQKINIISSRKPAILTFTPWSLGTEQAAEVVPLLVKSAIDWTDEEYVLKLIWMSYGQSQKQDSSMDV